MTKEDFKLQDPCDSLGDDLVQKTVALHYWYATFLGWTFHIFGLMYFLHTFFIGKFNMFHFASFWVVCTIFAMIASGMTMFVFVYKQVITVLRAIPATNRFVAEKKIVEEKEVKTEAVTV